MDSATYHTVYHRDLVCEPEEKTVHLVYMPPKPGDTSTKTPEAIKAHQTTSVTEQPHEDLENKYRVTENEQAPRPVFDFSDIQRRYVQADPSMRLLQTLVTLTDTTFTNDDTTWVSSTKPSDQKIIIGTKKLPENIARIYNWGVNTQEAENIIKVAHESSHALQAKKHLTDDWVRHKNGEKVLGGEVSYAFIYLYDMLSVNKKTKGAYATGLPSLPFYHNETEKIQANLENNGQDPETAIEVPVLEDITELIAAYLISDEYFAFRLEASGLDEAYKETATKLIIQIVHG